MPYGKFVHGIYRFGALALYAAERKADRPASTPAIQSRSGQA
jgi:citrate/tricarballylate utilization protein